MKAKKNEEIEQLQLLLKTGTEGQIQTFLCAISEKNQIQAYRVCLENQGRYLEEAVFSLLDNVSPISVLSEFDFLINSQASYKDKVRAYSRQLLQSLSSQQLSRKAEKLFFYLDSPCPLIRYLAEELLRKISPTDLSMEVVEKYYLLYRSDASRVARDLMIKIIKSWSPSEMINNFSYLLAFQSAVDTEIKELGDLGVLQVMEGWSIDRLAAELGNLVTFANSENYEVFELSAKLALRVLFEREVADNKYFLNYLVSLQKSVNEQTLRISEALALDVLMNASEDLLFEKRDFLILCQESKHSLIRRRALVLLDRIPVNRFADCTEDLLAYYKTGKYSLRKTVRRILYRIDSGKFVPILNKLLEAQRSVDAEFRELNASLALRIGSWQLAEQREYLSEMRDSKLINVAHLAQELYAKV